MRKVASLVCALFVAGLVLAQLTPALAAGKTHQLTATIVSVDMEKKTITIKDDKGEERTAPVLDKAVASLKNIHAGEKVNITCKDNDKGEHMGVTAIEAAKS